jgi:ABC-type molybdate transport system permease subunit
LGGAPAIPGANAQAPEGLPNPPEGKVTVKFWAIATQPWKEVIAEFTKVYPNIDIKWTKYSTDELKQALRVASASGKMPDMWFNWGGSLAAPFIDGGHALEITPELAVPFRWASKVFTFILVGLIVPIQMALVPLTLLMNFLNLIDTRTGLTLLYLGFGVPFGVLVMRGFFRTIPTDLIEAAQIDGCSYFRIFFQIALPLALPAVLSLCILDGVATWNEFILAQIFLRSDELRTLPLGLVNFSTQFSTEYNQLAAAVLISMVPLVLVFLFFQRYFVSGMAGAVK